MARRRARPLPAGDAGMMPSEVLLGDRDTRRDWLERRGLFTWREQYDMVRAARNAHGIPDDPDPRKLLRSP